VIESWAIRLSILSETAIDHGIEHPGRAPDGGTSRERARCTSRAVHSGAYVLVQVSDDGAGLDGDSIHAKAVEKGLIQADAQLPEQELWELILAPGFSTAQAGNRRFGTGSWHGRSQTHH